MDLLRAQQANQVYAFLEQAIGIALERNLMISIEHPRLSLYWRTKYWKRHAKAFNYICHQACAYQSKRPTYTAIAHNKPVLPSFVNFALVRVPRMCMSLAAS